MELPHYGKVFDGQGRYETQWVNMHRPCGLYCCAGNQPRFIIGELGAAMPVNRDMPNIGPRLSIVDAQGQLHRISSVIPGPDSAVANAVFAEIGEGRLGDHRCAGCVASRRPTDTIARPTAARSGTLAGSIVRLNLASKTAAAL